MVAQVPFGRVPVPGWGYLGLRLRGEALKLDGAEVFILRMLGFTLGWFRFCTGVGVAPRAAGRLARPFAVLVANKCGQSFKAAV